MTNEKILVLDIETSPMLAYVWELKEQYIRPNQIKDEWFILAWAAKWVGEPSSKVIYRDLRNQKVKNDKGILKDLLELLSAADIVLTQNGEKFDIRKLNARFITHGLKPPKPFRQFDTYKLVSRVAAFTSNSLAYLTGKLNKKYRKLSHPKYPGLELWKECLANNIDAWNEMKKYNIHDILSTEELYLNLRAWAPDSFPKAFNTTKTDKQCGSCGFVGKMRLGKPRKTKKRSYVQHSCPKCGTWQVGEAI